MSELIDRMRRNPQSGWVMRDVERACADSGVDCRPPTGGGSHYKVSHPSQAPILTIPIESRSSRFIFAWSSASSRLLNVTVIRNDYAVLIEPLAVEDGGGFLATVPDLPGCMSDGETREEAARNIEDAIGEWLRSAREMGRSIPKPSARTAAE